MEGWVPIFFLMVALKIPVGLLLWIVYWAIKAENPIEEAPEGGSERGDRRSHRRPRHPRGPRRGPHAPDALPVPAPGHDGRLRAPRPPAPLRAGLSRARGSAEPAPRD